MSSLQKASLECQGARDAERRHGESDTIPCAPLLAIRIYERVDERLASQWEQLADRVKAIPWLQRGWFIAWWRAFGKGALKILTVWKEDRLVGVLPLQERFGELQSTTNWHTPGYGLLAEGAAAAQELAQALFRLSVRRVSLFFLSQDDTALLEHSACAAGYWPIRRPVAHAMYLPSQKWEEYQKRFSGEFKRILRRRERRLVQDNGQLSLQIEDGSAQLEELLEEGFKVEASGWKSEAGSAIVSHPETRQFYSEVARWASKQGTLRLIFLRSQGHPIAFQYCLHKDGIYYFLKTGYDPTYALYGPGRLMCYKILAHVLSNGVASFELGPPEQWKYEWTDAVRDRLLFQAFAPSLSGCVDWTISTYGQALAKSVLARMPSHMRKQLLQRLGTSGNWRKGAHARAGTARADGHDDA